MALSRFDRPSRYSWDWQTYVPQFEQLDGKLLDETMGRIQQGVDQSNLISEKMPNVLQTEGDVNLFKEYKSDVDNQLSNVSQAYQRSLREGQAAQNQFLQNVRQDWMPGGRAYALNSRYEGYAKAQEELNKFQKEDPRGINAGLARYNLSKMLQDGPQYDSQGRTFRNISTPDLIKDPDIKKAALEMIKEIDESGDTQFLQGVDGDRRQGWITKIKTEGKSDARLRSAMEALLDMPEYSSQVQRDAQYQGLTTDLDLLKQSYQQSLESQLQAKQRVFDQTKQSKNPAQVREVQNFLSRMGVPVKEDGQWGPETERAIEEYKTRTKSNIDGALQNFDPQSYLQGKVRENYLDYAGGFANQKVDKDLVFDKVWQTRQKIAADRANTDKLVSAIDRLAPVKSDDVTVVDAPAIQFGDYRENLNKVQQTQMEAYKVAEQVKSQDPLFKGWKNEDVVAAYRAYEDLRKQNPNATSTQLQQAFGSKLKQWAGDKPYTLTPEIEQAVFNRVQQGRDQGTIQAVDQLWSVDEEVTRNKSLMNNFGQVYAETPEGKQNINEQLGRFRREGETDQQLLQRAIDRPQDFNRDITIPSGQGFAGITYGQTKSTTNPVALTLDRMQADVAKQQKQGSVNYLNNMGTTTLLFSDKDEFVGPTLKRIQDDVNNSPFGVYDSEGNQGLIFRDLDGKQISSVNPQNFKVTNTAISTDADGRTVLVLKGQEKRGQETKSVYTTIRPTVFQLAELRQGLSGELAAAHERGDFQKQIEIGKKIAGLGDTKWANYAAFDSSKEQLNRQNTQDLPVYFQRNGRLEPLPSTWQYSKDRLTQEISDGQNSYSYNIANAYDPQSGAKYTLNLQEQRDANGNPIYIAQPTPQGQLDYGSSVNAFIGNQNKEIIARTPVERTTSKVENPGVLNTLLGQ